ncbi:MAG: DUF2164 domain-containing protein [Endomicrobium sp.]|jgi:uncharacterized protein (DUF2164 family)|nr:DUF2164 domain-containing protein [Endomicrobium sp.]
MKINYNKIELSKEQKSQAISKLKKYLKENFDTEIGDLKAFLLLDFLSENIASYYYNKGLADSITVMKERLEDIYSLMKEEK